MTKRQLSNLMHDTANRQALIGHQVFMIFEEISGLEGKLVERLSNIKKYNKELQGVLDAFYEEQIKQVSEI